MPLKTNYSLLTVYVTYTRLFINLIKYGAIFPRRISFSNFLFKTQVIQSKTTWYNSFRIVPVGDT